MRAILLLAALTLDPANRAVDRGEFPLALKLANDYLASHPKSAPAQIVKARVFMATRDNASALRTLQGTLATEPANPDALFFLSRVARTLSDAQFESFQKTSASAPRMYLLAADTFRENNDAIAERYQIEQALAKDVRYVPALTALGDLDRRSGDCRAALRSYRRAAELDPANFEAAYGAGMCHLAAGDVASAWPELIRATAMDLSSTPAREAFREALRRGNPPRPPSPAQEPRSAAPPAAQQLSPALEARFRDSAQALRAGNLDLARTLLESILAKGGTAPFVYNNLGIIEQQRGAHAAAIRRFRQALQLDPDAPSTLLLLARSYAAVGQHSDAIPALVKTIRLDRRQPQAYAELAREYERTGDMPAAIGEYQKLVNLQPNEPEWAYQLARAYGALSAWAEQRLQCSATGVARAAQSEGERYAAHAQLQHAKEAFERAARANPALPGVHLALAKIYIRRNDLASALAEVDRELAVSPDSREALELRRRLTSQ